MKILVQLLKEELSPKPLTLGALEFVAAAEHPSRVLVAEAALDTFGALPVYVSATYAETNQNLSVFVKHGEQHIFTMMCHWGEVMPFCAFRLKDGDLIECYFET